MPDYIDTTTGQRRSLTTIRRAHPDRSIPESGDLSALGYAPLEPTEKPVPGDGEIIIPGPPEEYSSGRWRESWLTQPAPPPAVPERVTPRQARLALRKAGLLDQLPAAIASIEDPGTRADVEIEWEYSTSIERAHAWVEVLGAALGLDSDGLNALFIEAATL